MAVLIKNLESILVLVVVRQVDVLVQILVDLDVLRVRGEHLHFFTHGLDALFCALEDAHCHATEDGGTDSTHLDGVEAHGRAIENVCRDLHADVGAGSTTAHNHTLRLLLGGLLDDVKALTHGECNAFQEAAEDVCPVVGVGEAEDSALAARVEALMRGEEREEEETIGASGHVLGCFVHLTEELTVVVVTSGVLTAEPGDEPVAAIDVKFGVPPLLQSTGEGVELELSVADGLIHHDRQGCHGAVGDDGFFGGKGACTEGFNLLVTGSGDNGKSFGKTSDLGGVGSDVAEDATLLDEVKHLVAANTEDLIDEIVLEPVFGGVVEGEEATLHASSIGGLAGEFEGEVTGQGAVVGSLLVNLSSLYLSQLNLELDAAYSIRLRATPETTRVFMVALW